MNECPKRKLDVQVNFAEDHEDDYKENFVIEDEEKQPGKSEATDDEEEGIEGDMVGDVLVIRWSMLAPPVQEKDDWFHKNIFRTSCTSGGKLCYLITDSGSNENLVSQERVDKLKLKVVKHPQP
ncbi:hypothetical protein VitviT2T_024499 [Vitis vinifera]|uniref:Uncharacterized protein n=1 Tax=Vitis vinifera TaxID=29760 RepID=A0ABY9DFR7_VITVI|nr:hypothetical protein VitviT2T_024499 [Vitis vinifera]